MQPISTDRLGGPRAAARAGLRLGAIILLALAVTGLLGACVYGDNRTPRSSRSAAVTPPPGETVPPRSNTEEELPPPRRSNEAVEPRTEEGVRAPERRDDRKEARRPETPPSKAPPVTAPPSGRFYVEAGAYSDRRRADRERGTLDDLGAVRIKEVKRNGRSYYSVAIGPVANAEQGDRLLARIVRRGYNEARVIVE